MRIHIIIMAVLLLSCSSSGDNQQVEKDSVTDFDSISESDTSGDSGEEPEDVLPGDNVSPPDDSVEEVTPDTLEDLVPDAVPPQDTILPDTFIDTADTVESCGNGTCDEEEDPCSCPDDCLIMDETCCSESDCPQPSCGPCCKVLCEDFQCAQPLWEEPCCWNSACEEGEDFESCPEDCYCGNGTCDDSETVINCPDDCESQPASPECTPPPNNCGTAVGTVLVEVWPGGDGFPLSTPYPGCLIEAVAEGEVVAWDVSNETGEYELTLVPGEYTVKATHPDPEQPWDSIYPNDIETPVSVPESGQVTADFLFHYDGDTVDKPNIYLYPETTQQIAVQLSFAPGNFLVKADPDYIGGWNVTAEPNGLLDGKWGFLFYEAAVVTEFELSTGHNVPQEDLEAWMSAMLPAYGLNAVETQDFVDFWKDALPPAPWYVFHPVFNDQIEPEIGLSIQPVPDSLLRLWFVVVPAEAPKSLLEPQFKKFDRTGFTAVEWGVIVK
jgi:hypothetical protein